MKLFRADVHVGMHGHGPLHVSLGPVEPTTEPFLYSGSHAGVGVCIRLIANRYTGTTRGWDGIEIPPPSINPEELLKRTLLETYYWKPDWLRLVDDTWYFDLSAFRKNYYDYVVPETWMQGVAVCKPYCLPWTFIDQVHDFDNILFARKFGGEIRASTVGPIILRDQDSFTSSKPFLAPGEQEGCELIAKQWEAYFYFVVTMEDYTMGGSKQIFLSHKGADKLMVREYFRVLKTLSFDPWLDEDAMVAGTLLERGILEGFERSCAAVFFVTPSFRDENFLATEVNYAVAEKRKKGDRFAIITVVFSEKKQKGKVPALLEQYVWKEPRSHLEALDEILRALPIRPLEIRWKAHDCPA